MADLFDEQLGRLGAPRPLDAGFRDRLESVIVDATSGDPVVGRWRIDGPRELAPGFKARLEAGLTSPRRRPRSLVKLIAAAAVVMLAAGATVVVVDRLGSPNRDVAGGPILRPSPSPAPAPPKVRPKGSLEGFRSERAFLAYVREEGLKLVGPYGINGSAGPWYGGTFYGGTFAPPIAAPAAGTGSRSGPIMAPPQPAATGGQSFSGTNIQEGGVDEPDIVKTDGRRLIVLAGSDVRILDVQNGVARIRGTVRILNGIGVFLDGDKVIHFAALNQAPPEGVRVTHSANRLWTKVSVIDIADLDHPKVLSSMSIEGAFVGARLVRGTVRLIVQSGGLGPAPVTLPNGNQKEPDRAKEQNMAAIRGSSVGDWVPHFVVKRLHGGTTTGHVHDWRAVSRPPDKAGLSMLTLVTIDPADPRPDNANSVIGAGEIIYSSLDNLYVTSGRIDDVLSVQRGRAPKEPITRIHKFDISDPSRAVYRGSGVVPGFLLNQFSLSEFEGYLRVATTLEPPFTTAGQGASKSSVFVMKERAGRLVVAGTIGNLGVGERIYAVRFLGSKGYIVTFRQIDPLFVIDLRVPSRPRLAGKLKVPGYSGYLHPIGEDLLLGIGQEADSNGRVKGLKVSMFNVADPTHPRQLDSLTAGTYGESEAVTDHHAFLYWEPTRLVVLPVVLTDENYTQAFTGALAVHMSRSGALGTSVRISHSGRPNTENADIYIHRSLVIGSRLLTISGAGVLLSDLETLHSRSWVPFQD